MLRSSCRALKRCRWWQARGAAEIVGVMVGNCTKRQQIQNDRSTTRMTYVVQYDNDKRKGDWGMCDLPCADTPRAIIGSRRRDNDTRTPRVWGSRGRRFCQALPAGVAKGRATGTDRSLCHKVFVRSGPDTDAVMRTSQQRTIGLGPDCTPAMTSLLHARWQGVVATAPLGAGISPIRGVIQRQTPCSLRAPNGFFPYPVPLPLPGGDVNHHKLPCRLRPSALLIALGLETNRLIWRRRVATVACGGGGGEV